MGTAVQGPLLVRIGPGVFPAISEFRALVFLSIGHHSVHTGKTMSHHSSEGTWVAVPAKIFRAELFRLTC